MKSCSVINRYVSDEYPDLNPWFNNVGTLCLLRCFSMCSQIAFSSNLKQLAPELTSIYQKFIDTGTLPRDWLNANVSCIIKKGDKHAPENYRPVFIFL
jgi:hypothetical protein